MKRWKKALIISGAVLVVVAGGTLWAMNKAVDKVLEAVSSDVLATMNSPALGPSETPSSNNKPNSTSEANSDPSIRPESQAVRDDSVPTSSPVAKQANPGDSVSPMSDITSTSQPEPSPSLQPTNTPYNPSIDADKAQKAQEEVTLNEKLQISTIFLKRFSAKELDAFMKLASGGLSLEEKKEAKKLVLEKLTEEEYDQLIGIAAKLGLSEGKNYAESEKELLSK